MRFYRLLLRLYPSSFRQEYGGEMTSVLRDRLRDAGPLGRVGVWAGGTAEVLAGAAAVHWDILRQDLHYTARTLRRTPAFTLTAILLLAIGIGANTAVFSITDFALLRPLPFPEPDRLVKLWQSVPGYYSRTVVSPENYRDWKRQSRSYESMGAAWALSANLVVRGAEPERIDGAAVTADLLPTLGVRPALGRWFSEEEDRENAAGTIMLSDALWRGLFGGDSSVLGRQITLDDQPYLVIGVMPSSFSFPSRQAEFWTTLRLSPRDTDRTNTYLEVVARLKPGITIGQARAEIAAIANRLAVQYPKENEQITAVAIGMRDEVPRQSRMLILALNGAALCVLLIVCANLANLLMARALARRRELAVRTAIGAGRDRLLRQLATESGMLALAGGMLGVGVAYAAVPVLAQLTPVNLPSPESPAVDPRVLVFAFGLTALTGVIFGLLPALRIGRVVDAEGLREGARSGARGDRVRAALVVTEVIASIVLLVGAGLLIRALWRIQHVDPGFRADRVLTMRTTLAWPKYRETEKRASFYLRVLDEVRHLPGVTSAAYISGLPMVTRGGIWSVLLNGDTASRRASQSVSLRYTTPDFFRTLDIPLLKGRDVSDADTAGSQFVAVVSESFARRYWPGADPIGRRFTVAFAERTICGVVADIRVRGLEAASEPQVYIPYRQIPDGYMSTYAPKDLAIQSPAPLEQLVPAVRAIIRRADPQEPISDIRPLADIVGRETAPRAQQVRVLAAFAATAVLLAAIGLHGLLMFAVSQRTQEFGVRLALGAQPGNLARSVLAQGAVLALAGAVPGLLLAYAAGRSLQALLAGVEPGDPLTFGTVAIVTIGIALAGSLAAARRAFRLNPVDALRVEA